VTVGSRKGLCSVGLVSSVLVMHVICTNRHFEPALVECDAQSVPQDMGLNVLFYMPSRSNAFRSIYGKVRLKLSLCLIKRHAMKTYVGVEV